VNSRESTKDKHREVEHIIDALGDWQGADPTTGFQLVKTPEGRVLKIADLVDDEAVKRDSVSAALKDPAQKNNRDHVDIIIALGMAKEGFDFPPNGFKPPASSRSASANLSLIFSPEF
jgi:hypothetical protein